jgi:hypothetical protein
MFDEKTRGQKSNETVSLKNTGGIMIVLSSEIENTSVPVADTQQLANVSRIQSLCKRRR